MWSNWTVRALVQRVSSASVLDRGAQERLGTIGSGLLVLVGVTHSDGDSQVAKLAGKIWNLRVFPDDAGAMNRSLGDWNAGGEPAEVLVVSQFTLYGDTRKGRRPSFVDAAAPEQAEPLLDALVAALRDLGAEVATGRFRSDMEVSLVNDGPVTLMIEV